MNNDENVPAMSDEISQEKAREYRAVAAMMCQDIDVLFEVSTFGEPTAEQLKKQIALTHKLKEELIRDPEIRARRYLAACTIEYTIRQGVVVSDERGMR